MIKREHSIHGHRLDVRIFYPHMGIEPFIDGSNIGKKPEPVYYRAIEDSRYAFLLKNRPLLEELREQLKALHAQISLENEGTIEINFTEVRLPVKRRWKWTKDIEQFVEQFLTDRLIVHQLPWNNKKIPSITSEQLADLSLKDNTRLMQLVPPSENQQDHILVTAFKEHLNRALNELTDMLTARTVPLNEAVYRSKPVGATRDPKVNNHRASFIYRSSPPPPPPNIRQSIEYPPPPPLLLLSPSIANIDDSLENLRLSHIDLLSMRFIELAKRTYTNLSIDIDKNHRRVVLRGPLDQVNICKNYFESILTAIIHKHYKVGKEMAVFLSNPDTGKHSTHHENTSFHSII